MTGPYRREEIERLRAIREVLIGMETRPDGAPAPTYWDDPESIRLYDEVFAARIGWKWDAALDEALERFAAPLAPRTVVDFGAGTGVAVERVLSRIPAPERVVVVDRDEGARAFACEKLSEAFPGVEFEARASVGAARFDLALASHVLDELDDEGERVLEGLLRGARAVLWVEPGSKRTSRRLSAARDRMLDDFEPVAPCPHRERCGILAEGRERDWCHLFARPPAEVHTTARWTQIGKELRIDLRSLPYSFVALDREPPRPAPGRRVLGRPRLQRGRALVDLCGPEGVESTQLLQRDHKDLFKALKKDATILRHEP